MPSTPLGELEQAVLLAILSQGDRAFALEVRLEMERESGRPISRGAFYTTLERMKKKGWVDWVGLQPAHARRKGVQRLFSVTPRGMAALRTTEEALKERCRRLAEVLES